MTTLAEVWRSAGVLLYVAQLGRTGEAEISRALGCSQETARNHLAALEQHGLIERVSRFSGYALTDAGYGLISNAENPRSNAENPRSHQNDDDPESLERGISAHERGKTAHERGISALDPLLLTTTINPLIKSEVVVSNNGSNAEKPRSNAEKPRMNAENPRMLANLETLRKNGFSINDRTTALAALPHVSPEYITAIWQDTQALDDHRKRNRGFCIHRIQSGEQPGKGDGNEHDRSRYTNGKYSEFINH